MEYYPNGDLFDYLNQLHETERQQMKDYYEARFQAPKSKVEELENQVREHHSHIRKVALQMIQELTLALDYCFKLGFTHLDVKPENVLLDQGKHAQLTDFGLYLWLGETITTIDTVYCGSQHYVSPQIHQNQSYCPKQTNVWSLGVILFCMLMGYMPFDSETGDMVALKKSVCRGEYTVAEWIKEEMPDVLDLLNNMLKTAPSQRLPFDDLLKHPAFGTIHPVRPIQHYYNCDHSRILYFYRCRSRYSTFNLSRSALSDMASIFNVSERILTHQFFDRRLPFAREIRFMYLELTQELRPTKDESQCEDVRNVHASTVVYIDSTETPKAETSALIPITTTSEPISSNVVTQLVDTFQHFLTRCHSWIYG